jgi:Tfp pilus assembly protein PilN
MTIPAEPPRDPGELLTALLGESQRLRADVRDRERRQRRLMGLIAATVVVCLVLVTSVMVLLVQSRQRGNDTRALLRTNAATNERIADCTTVGGKCYEEGSKRSAAFIQLLLQGQKQIALCRSESDTSAELEKCIDKALAAMTAPSPTASTGGKP